MRVKLGDVCTVRSSLVDPMKSEYRDLPHVAPDSIERESGRLLGIRTAAEDRVTSGKYLFESGDILYSKIRPNLNKVVRIDFAGVCSADMYALTVDENRITARFLVRLLRDRSFLDYATALSNRASIPKLNRSQLLGFAVDLPPLDQQRRIAAILDQADVLRAKRRQVLARLDTLAQSIFRDMFGDPDAAEGVTSFGDVASLEGGRNLVADDGSSDSAYRVLKISAVTSGHFKGWESKPLPADYTPPDSHLVREGDLLMSRANTADLVGAVALVCGVPPNMALPDKIWRFKWHDIRSVPVFYHALFQSRPIRRRISQMASGTGGSMKNVSKAKLQSLILPDVGIEQQRAFARRVAAIPRPNLGLLDELFASLQLRAFRGEL